MPTLTRRSFSKSFCVASRNSWASWASQNCARSGSEWPALAHSGHSAFRKFASTLPNGSILQDFAEQVGQTSLVAGNGAGEGEVAGDAVICSALDLLVQAMKRRRALVPEAIQIRPDMSVKEQVAVTVNANHGKDPDGDQVIQSAVNVLIQAMKLRGSSTMEL